MTSSRHTRKKRADGPVTTLVELKSVFDRVRKGALSIIKGTPEKKQRIKKLQALLREHFHHPVQPMAAEAYLHVIEKGMGTKRGTRRRKQKGGMAPLDFQTRPGIDGVHGSFPQYLTGGLSFYNTINKEGMFQDCGKVDITPAVPVSIGSNQAGGAGVSMGTVLSDAISLGMTRPFTSTSPSSVGQDIQTISQGRDLPASPRADQNPLKYI
jgi:hypothetical protein